MDGVELPELQVQRRLHVLLDGQKYSVSPDDLPRWKEVLMNPDEGVYARLCAASILLDSDADARAFIEQQLDAVDLRHRYNAVAILCSAKTTGANVDWKNRLLTASVANGSLDQASNQSLIGAFPAGDQYDLQFPPLAQICGYLGKIKDAEAVPALIACVERAGPLKAAAAVRALAELNDRRSDALLLGMAVNRYQVGPGDKEVVTALGEMKSLDAVPILISQLPPKVDSNTDDEAFIHVTFEAFKSIGSPEAIPALRRFLTQNYPENLKAEAREALSQLTAKGPVHNYPRALPVTP